MANAISTAFNGLSMSSVILLTSLGLSITFGLMRVINMAHGEFVMVGAYVTYCVQRAFIALVPSHLFGLYFPVALLFAFGASFMLGNILESLVISRLYGREIDSLLVTSGLSMILQQAARSVFGAQGVLVAAPSYLAGGIRLGSVSFSYNRLFILALAGAIVTGVYLVMTRTSFGLEMRAVMQNRSMAQALGVNSRRIDNLTFSIGSGLAGLAGCSVALLGSVDASTGQAYIVNAFIAVVVGGTGSLAGTVAGAAIIGYASIVLERYTSASIAKALVLILIIAVLSFKPQGLFAIRTRNLDD